MTPVGHADGHFGDDPIGFLREGHGTLASLLARCARAGEPFVSEAAMYADPAWTVVQTRVLIRRELATVLPTRRCHDSDSRGKLFAFVSRFFPWLVDRIAAGAESVRARHTVVGSAGHS